MATERLAVALLTREYPPDVYGGAGVHVEYLAPELARLTDLEVHCFGTPRPQPDGFAVHAYEPPEALGNGALDAMAVDLAMAGHAGEADVVHSHTWYAQFGGHLAKLLHGIPHVATVHSLEPLRPWKKEQLGGGYALSSLCERIAVEGADAIVAVSEEMKADIVRAYPAVDPNRIRVIHNGIDADEFHPTQGVGGLTAHGVDPDRPYLLFVGRITRQKGLGHLLRAAPAIDHDAQLVLCIGSPDTPELEHEIAAQIAEVERLRGNVVVVAGMTPRPELIELLAHAAVFVCPSIYEPLGIVNLEAMACETPVVATATGGIPEVVADGETGLLVPFTSGDDVTREPADPASFAADLAERVNELLADPERARAMGRAGRVRVLEHFAWQAIAEETVDLYRSVVAANGGAK